MDIFRTALIVMSYLFFLFLIVYSIYLFLTIALGFILLHRKAAYRRLNSRLSSDYDIPISILIPTHNHEKVIVNTMDNLLKLKYKAYEIIIVDNGSSDNTIDLLVKHLRMRKINRPIRKQLQASDVKEVYEGMCDSIKITLVKKEFCNQAESLNTAIDLATYPYITCIDATTTFAQDALINIVRPILENEEMIVCSGSVRVNNKNKKEKSYSLPQGVLPSMQALEYNRYFLAERRANIAPSVKTFNLFKKDSVIAVGGFDLSSSGQDYELILKLKAHAKKQKISYISQYVPEAICFVEVPNTVMKFLHQKSSQNRAVVLGKLKNKKSVWDVLYALLYGWAFPILEFLGIFAMILACYLHLIDVGGTIIFLISYTIFCAFLTFYIFTARFTIEFVALSFFSKIGIFATALLETIILKPLILIAKIFSLLPRRSEAKLIEKKGS